MKLWGDKLVTSDRTIIYLASEPNYHTTKWFAENLLALKINKTKVTMKKPVFVGLLIPDLSKIAQYKYRYNYTKPEYGDNTKLCFTDTDSFILKNKIRRYLWRPCGDLMLRRDSIHQIMKLLDHYPLGKIKN